MSESTSKLPISVCVLSLNEEGNLPRCLAEIEHFAEWIVLDTGSTDDSIKIARSLGARVETSPWLGFSNTRRHHFGLAAQPWILWIDADEYITPELVAELRKLFASGNNLPHSAYQINRLMYFENRWIRHGDWFPDWVTRLFRTDSWSMPERDVHESLDISGTTERLHETLPHYSYLDWEDRRCRAESYSSLWAKQQAAQGMRTPRYRPILRATWKLFRGLILKHGFLNGSLGVKIAWSNALEVYKKHEKLRKISS